MHKWKDQLSSTKYDGSRDRGARGVVWKVVRVVAGRLKKMGGARVLIETT